MDFMKLVAVTLIAIALAGATRAESFPAAKEAPGFTLPDAEHRALLSKAQAADAQREQAKAKGPTLTIVEDGKPLATIVGSGKAAGIVQEWVKLMSGAELPIAETAPANGPAIYIGEAAVAAGLKLDDIQSDSSEGLRVKCDGKNIFIAGQDENSTIRAAGRFLEEEFGCRFLSNKPWGMVYPEQSTLKVLVREFTEQPTFRYRRIWGPEGAIGHRYWKTWAGDGGIATPMSHSGLSLPEGSFEKHPEWYRMDEDGNRVEGHWLNLGHPEVRKMFIEAAVARSKGGTQSISLSPPDDHRVDYSPEARKYDEPAEIDPSTERVSMTNRFLGLVNEAAKKIYELSPEASIGFYAYSDYTLPPTNPALDKLSPNIEIWIAPIRYSRYHPIGHPHSESRKRLKTIVEGWSTRAARIGWREYNFNLAEVLTPFSKITVWSHDLPYLKKMNAAGANLETIDAWELYAPHLYLSIRLSYDPTANPWEIMADYWHKAYGAAAEPMMDYWMSIDRAFAHILSESGSFHALHLVYTPERMAHLDRLLGEAEQLVSGHPRDAERVNLARRGFRRAQYWRTWHDAIERGEVAKAFDTVQEWHAFVLEAIERRDANVYEERYLRRFIMTLTRRAALFVNPEDGPAKTVLDILPDEWRFANGDMLEASGFTGDPFAPDADLSRWDTVRTYSATLNEQGYEDYFGPMWYRTAWTAPKDLGSGQSLWFVKADRKITLYIDGKQVGDEAIEGFNGNGIDVTGALKPGQEHQITVRIDHIPMPELFLGGLVKPVYLVRHAQQ